MKEDELTGATPDRLTSDFFRRECLCFVHIERAGGTTLHRILQQNFPTYSVLAPFLWPHEPGNVFTEQEARWFFRLLPWTPGFGGHSTRSYLSYASAIGRPVRYVTFLRNPITRYLSHFNHQRASMGISWTLDEFLRDQRFANFATHRLAGRLDVEEAKRVLREDFTFVGLTERFDESLILLRDALSAPKLNINYELQNLGRNPEYRALKIDQKLYARVAEVNQADLEVYDLARRLFEERAERMDETLHAQVRDLRAQNLTFRFRRRDRILATSYRWFCRQPVEFVLRRRFHPSEDTLQSLRQRAVSVARRYGYR